METWHYMWMVALGWGLVSAGLTGSAYALVAGEKPHLYILERYHITTPVRALALMAYAPMALVKEGWSYGSVNPVFGLLLFTVGTVWSFLQGVFIMITVFGVT